MDPFLVKKSACFVKMSDRSPKDSVTERGRIQKFLANPLKEVENRDLASSEFGLPAVYRAFNQGLYLCCRYSPQALKVTSAHEAMELLLTSFRTLEDVMMRLEYKSTLWELVIVVREWVDFDPSLEYAGVQ